MSDPWGQPQPPASDPWGQGPRANPDPWGTAPGGAPADPWGRTQLGPDAPTERIHPPGAAGVDQYGRPLGGFPPDPPTGTMIGQQPPRPPGLAPTIVVTVLFGLFGLIPASIHASRARALGLPGARYWQAFGGALVLAVVIQGVIGGLLWNQLRATAPGLATGPAAAETAAPATDQTRAPVESAPAPAPTTTSAAAPTPESRTVTSLPSGTWLTVLDSLPKGERTEAEAWAMADSLSGQARVVVVDSDRIPGLRAGYWAVAIPGSSSRDQASALCAGVGRSVGGTCYPRQVA